VTVTCAEKQYLVAYLREAAADGGEVAPEKLARAADALEAGLAEAGIAEAGRMRDVANRLDALWARCDRGMDAKTASECRNVMSAAEEIIQDMLSDEREGRCFCDVCVVYGGMWVGDTGNRYTRPFCFGCGAALGADGIARRNADAARIDALERMVQESAERGETVELDQRGTGGVSLQRWCPLNAVTETVSSGATLRDAIDAAVAAQGGDECE